MKKIVSVSTLLADTGYHCKDDIAQFKELNVPPIIAEKRKNIIPGRKSNLKQMMHKKKQI